VAQGTVKWFNAGSGHGSVQPDDGTADVFVHYCAIQADVFRISHTEMPTPFCLVMHDRLRTRFPERHSGELKGVLRWRRGRCGTKLLPGCRHQMLV
jgi:cold shock CspA family protein